MRSNIGVTHCTIHRVEQFGAMYMHNHDAYNIWYEGIWMGPVS